MVERPEGEKARSGERGGIREKESVCERQRQGGREGRMQGWMEAGRQEGRETGSQGGCEAW